MSLLQFLRILLARQTIIWAAFLGCVITALVVSQLLPPRYEASSKVLLNVLKPDPVTGEVMGLRDMRPYVATQIALIKDYGTTGRVVDQLGWAEQPEIVARFQRSSAAASGDIRRWLADQIADSLDVKLLENSNILLITYTGASPEAARDIANGVRDAFVRESLDTRRGGAAETAEWYSAQVAKARADLTASEDARTAYAKANGIVIGPGDTDLESQRLQTLSAQAASSAALPPIPQAVNPLAVQLDALDQQIAQAASTLGPNHPTLQALQRQRQALATNIARQSASLYSGGGGAIEGMYEAQKSRVMAQQDKINRFNQMNQDIAIKREQYQKAQQRLADLRLEAEVTKSEVSSLDSASTPTRPSFPNVPLVAAGAAVLGLGLGVSIALLMELLNRRIRSDEDLEYAARASVFAIVGRQRDPDGLVARLLRIIDRRRKRTPPAEAVP